MKVIVVKTAFFAGNLVYPSPEPIEVPDGTKGSWFVPAGSEEAKAAKAAGKAEGKGTQPMPQTLSEIGKGNGRSFNDVHGGKQAAKAAGKAEAGDGTAA